MTEAFRKPAVFSADDPRIVLAAPEEATRSENALTVPEMTDVAPAMRPRRVRWGALFWSGLSGLVMLGLGIAITNFVEELFARSPWLGAIGAGLAGLTGVALLAIIAKEIYGLARLSTVQTLHDRAVATVATDDRDEGRAIVGDLLSLTNRMPKLARGRARIQEHLSEIIDGRDLIRIAERELMTPLDAEARQIVASASKRVSVVTAVSPRAAVDMIFVLVNALSMVRKLAVLYGGRPGALGVIKLLRQTVSHLAVTGGVAMTDSIVQQVIGHGVAARLSSKLGEGVLNGLLTARLGLMAIDLTRPLPFAELPRPSINDLAGGLLRSASGKGDKAEGEVS
jgi:putative membrane protein